MSLLGHRVNSLPRSYPPVQCRCRSRARASLRNRHQGPSIMGVENEAEQSFGRPCCQTNGRAKRPSELASSIVPRGTSFHRRVELKYSPMGCYPVRASSRCDLPGPTELGAINPDAVLITASRRANATIAFFFPRFLAIFIAQALSQDHLLVRVSMTWAAS